MTPSPPAYLMRDLMRRLDTQPGLDVKRAPEMQKMVLWGVVVRLHATGKWSDDDLMELVRLVLAKMDT